MLPGFRFLFGAIVLSTSVLVFGLGAASILRAAHEQFASSTSWRPAPDTPAAQQSEMTKPTLAMLRVDPPAAEPAKTAEVSAPVAPAEQTENTAAQPAPEQTAALSPGPSRADTAAPDVATSETRQGEASDSTAAAAPAPATQEAAAPETPPAPTDASAEKPTSAETTTATAEPDPVATPAAPPAITTATPDANQPLAPAASEPAQAAPQQANSPTVGESDPATTKIATLGGPPVVIDPSTDRDEVKKEKERARHRRLLAARRAWLARQAAAQQTAFNPFAQPPFQPTPTQFAQPTVAARTP